MKPGYLATWLDWTSNRKGESALIATLRVDSSSRSRKTSGRNGENRSFTTSANPLAVMAFRSVTVKVGESLEAFLTWSLRSDGDPVQEVAGSLGWTIRTHPQRGLPGVKRSNGTFQEDWAIVKSYALPDDLCIAVIGHRGSTSDPDLVARYTVATTYDVAGQALPIFEPLRTAVLELQPQVEAEVEEELEMRVEELGADK